jgi:hypothetical protein
MAEESLELRLNLNRRFRSQTPEAGMLVAFLPQEERERYMQGGFRELVQYVLDNAAESSQQEPLSQEQKNTYNSIMSKIETEVSNSRVRIRLYDKDFQPIRREGESAGDIYLSDAVSNRVEPDLECIGLGIDTSPGVG